MLIKPQQLSMLVGPAGSGKTFVAVDLACSVVFGLPWLGWQVPSGSAVYITNESGVYRQRVEAWKQSNGARLMDLFMVGAHGIDLTKCKAGDFAKFVVEYYGIPLPIDLVVIDTFNDMVGSSNLNTVEMALALDQIDTLIANTGAHVMLVCHQQKTMPRGRPLLGSAVDLILGMADRSVMVLKQAVTPEGPDAIRTFQLQPIRIDVDAKGDPISTCVVKRT